MKQGGPISEGKLKAVQERLQEKSRSSAAPVSRSKMDVIRASFDHIVRLQKKGFRPEEIAAEIVAAGGFDLSAGTLKNYMHRIRVERDLQSHAPAPRRRGGDAGKEAGPKKKEAVAGSRAPAPAEEKKNTDRGAFHIKPDRDNL